MMILRMHNTSQRQASREDAALLVCAKIFNSSRALTQKKESFVKNLRQLLTEVRIIAGIMVRHIDDTLNLRHFFFDA